MKHLSGKKVLPHIFALLVFLLISVIYFSPVLDGKELRQHDKTTFRGMSQEVKQYNQTHDDKALWTNSMFGGMPAYLIHVPFTSNLMRGVHLLINFNNLRPICFLFIYLAGFYLAMLLFGLNPWLSMVGAAAFGFSSYFLIIIAAGHNSKAHAVGYMAPIIAGVYYAFRKNGWRGAVVMGLFLSMQLYVNHLQITYYTFLVVLFLGVAELVRAFREKRLPAFFRTIAILVLFAVLAVGSSAGKLWTTFEYGNYSIRGKSELSHNQENKTSGLDKDYATAWSYGVGETLSLMIPNIKGGSSFGGFDEDSETFKTLRQNQVPNAKKIVGQLPGYWGEQSVTWGPVYAGAIVCFLFVLGLFLVGGTLRGWIVAATILSILLGWGKHFMPLTDFFLDFVPGYNKFRTVSMVLVIAEFTFPLLGLLALKKIFDDKVEKAQLMKALKWSVGITGGISLLFFLVPGLSGTFASPADVQLPDWLRESIQLDRKSLLRSDALRSLILIVLAASTILAFYLKKLKPNVAILVLGVLILGDLWAVNKRYLNNDNFVSVREAKKEFQLTTADKEILKDKDPNYRVLNLAVSTFNDASTSYHHKSIGGYHGAKMRRYQELIELQLTPEMQQVGKKLGEIKSVEELGNLFAETPVLNMLNTKYLIFNPQAAPIRNTNALGSAWVVDEAHVVATADDEIAALGVINPAKEAVVNNAFSNQLSALSAQQDEEATLKLIAYSPNEVSYQFNGKTSRLGIFSEIYYPKGWNAYIDNKLVSYFRANYVLRAMVLPAGDYRVRFKFEPKAYSYGADISLVSSLLLLILAIGIFLKSSGLIKKNGTKSATN